MISVGNVELDAIIQELQLQVVSLSERNAQKAATIAALQAVNAELAKRIEAEKQPFVPAVP